MSAQRRLDGAAETLQTPPSSRAAAGRCRPPTLVRRATPAPGPSAPGTTRCGSPTLASCSLAARMVLSPEQYIFNLDKV